jgi:ribose transport system permease protein
MSTDMIIAIPMAISLIAGNIDFSVGSNLCLSSAIAALALNNGFGTFFAILIGLASGTLFGIINAVIINHLKLTPLVATLGTWMAYRGIALVVLGGGTLSRFPDSFLILGRATVMGIPITIIYMFIIIILGIFILRYIDFFHNAYFIGSNKFSATLAGINRVKFVYITYAITGLVSAFAGIILAARLGSSSQNAGTSLEFRNVVALLVGGISMDGGEGNLTGVILGVLLMQLVGNAIVLLYLNTSYTQVINGSILILAIAIDMLSKQRKVKTI